MSLIAHAMETSKHHRFVIDGFPRNRDNLLEWERVMGPRVDLRFVLFLDCADEVLIDRVLRRGRHSGRSDDNADALKLRLETFRKETMPVVEHFQHIHKCHVVNTALTEDAVFDEIRTLFAGSREFN